MGSKGWRLSSAEVTAKKFRCVEECCRDDDDNSGCDHWRQLSRYTLELCSCVSQADRVATLKSLAALLLCLTASDNPANAGEGYALSMSVGQDAVTVAHDDVLRLSKVLFQELGKISGYLWYIPEVEYSSPGIKEVHLEAFVQTLCCCIRIIPVVDMFNTSMSHYAASTVHDMLHHLCSSSKFFPLGSPYTAKEHQDVVLRSSLLEVFLDEILLHRALTFPDDQGLSYRASIEAAFAHMLHYEFLQGRSELPGQLSYSRLSLPAGVLLLDMSANNRVPNELLTHIISLVTGALIPGSTSCGELDVSLDRIQAQTNLPNHFQIDDDLPHGVAIGLASSVVETAMGLLSRYYSASVSRDRDGSEWSGTHALSFVGCSSDQGEDFSMLASLLRAISCAINRLVREICSMKHQDKDGKLTYGDGFGALAIQRVFDTVANSMSFNMPSTKFMQAIGCFEQDMVEVLTSNDGRGTIGWALVIFSHILCYESQRGLEEVVTVEYLRLLDSLLVLLLLEGRTGNESGTDEISASTNFFLHRMIKSLQRSAWDMCSSKKSTAKLLSFISKVRPLRLPTTSTEKSGISCTKDFPTIVNCATPDRRILPTNKAPDFSFEAEHEVQEVIQEVTMEEASDSTAPLRPRPSTLIIAKRFKMKKHRLDQQTCTDEKKTLVEETEELEIVTKKKRRRGSGRKICTSETCIGKRTRSATKKNAASETSKPDDNVNPFVALMVTEEISRESFSDLNDFIVCKEGRNYAKFLHSRIKYRRKSLIRMIWKRRDEKQNLMRMLELCDGAL